MSEPTLKADIDRVLSHIAANAPPEATQTIMSEIAALVERDDLKRALGVGAAAPGFTLPDFTGQMVSLAELRAPGPAVVKFMRGTWCPFCDLELKATSKALKQHDRLGASIVVLMPQAPERVQAAAAGQDYGFRILHDLGSAVARQYGVAFTLPEPLRPIYSSFEMDASKWNSDGTWTLPYPATFVVDRGGRITYAFASANWTVRPEPEDVIAAVTRAARE